MNQTPIQNTLQRLKDVKETEAGWKALCPAHKDGNPSLSIKEASDGKVLLKCFAGCEFNAICATIGLEPEDLFPKHNNNSARAKAFNWQSCVDALTDEDLARLGNQRWWSRAFCVWLRDEKQIGLYKGHFAFPVERNGKIVAAKYKWGSGPNDWKVYPTEQGAACFILGDPKKAKNIHLDESQWDMCSLADRTDWFRDADNHAFVATPGAGNAKLIKGLIPAGAAYWHGRKTIHLAKSGCGMLRDMPMCQ